MNSIVLTTTNSSTSDPNKFSYRLSNSMVLKDNLICLSNLNIYYTWRNFKEEYDNTSLEYVYIPKNVTVPIKIPDGSYDIKQLNNVIHHFMKQNKHVEQDDSYGINLYPNPVYNRVTVSVSSEFKISKMSNGLQKTLGIDASQLPLRNIDVNGLHVPKIERVEAVLVHCNLVQNLYQQDSSLIYSFTPSGSYGMLLSEKPNFPLWRETRQNSEINEINIHFTDQEYRPLEVEDSVLIELQLVHESYIKRRG